MFYSCIPRRFLITFSMETKTNSGGYIMISFDCKNKTFKLDTPNTSYVIGVVDFDQLVNLYYGDKIADTEGLEARSFRPRWTFRPTTRRWNTAATAAAISERVRSR